MNATMDVRRDTQRQIRNEHIRETTIVEQASKKIMERRLTWYGHVMRRDEEHILRKMLITDIPEKRKIGRPKTRWKETRKVLG